MTETDEADRESGSRPYVETAFLADRAELVNGKLYVMGGYIDAALLREFPGVAQLSLGIVIGTPWLALDRSFSLTVAISPKDREPVVTLRSTIMTQRSPFSPDGSVQKVQTAIPSLNLPIEAPGEFSIAISVDDQKPFVFAFRAIQFG